MLFAILYLKSYLWGRFAIEYSYWPGFFKLYMNNLKRICCRIRCANYSICLQITSTNARALLRVLKFYFSMHIYNSQLTMKIQNKSMIS
jgi:hypothetical protein